MFLMNMPFFKVREGSPEFGGGFPLGGEADVFQEVDTDVVVKKDLRRDEDLKAMHWKEKKKDVDEKEDRDVLHRYPQVLSDASITDCNKKKKNLFTSYNQIKEIQKEIKYMQEWVNKLVPRIVKNKKMCDKTTNNIVKNQQFISSAIANAQAAADNI